jgi:[ribosomal protein S5]-alanine N-acetyltransferase
MLLTCATCRIRPWHLDDSDALIRHANNPRVAENLRDRFPSPYTQADADSWLSIVTQGDPLLDFAIVVDDEPVGGIGLALGSDIERVSAEVGYWVGEAFWGRGIATDALRAFVPWAMGSFALTRLYATTFAHHHASRRVLEKAGFTLEGILRRAAIKREGILDMALYGFVPDSSYITTEL